MPGGSAATEFSVALLREFVALGVRHVVVSPGSRSQALALAAAAFEREGVIALHVRIDERAGGFLALGLGVETGVPALVITTSGTAVANLHPAVLEAHHSGVPMLLLTADRPAELRGIGSNQTTVQVGLFGGAVRFVRDVQAPDHGWGSTKAAASLAREAFAAASGHSSAPGPAQLNLSFREPLSGVIDGHGLTTASIHLHPVREVASEPLDPSDDTIVIAGHGAGARAESLAREFGVPLVAEVSSGAHFGPNLVVAYRQLLGDPQFGGRVRRAIVFGHPTLSREVPALLERRDVETIIVRGPGYEDYNPARRAARIVDGVHFDGRHGDERPGGREWLGRWVQASRAILPIDPTPADPTPADPTPADPPPAADARTDDNRAMAEFARAQLAVFRTPVTRRMLVEAVWRATWPHDRLVFGASRLIRDADRVVTGKKISVHANRGLAGIDGTISTAAGIALASEAAGSRGVTRVVLGDLTLLHDVGAMLFGSGETRPRLQLIVGNDGGGTIFDSLEVAASANREEFDRVLYTPHAVRLHALAEAYGWHYVRATNRGELEEALAPVGAPTLVEVPLPR